MDNEKNQTYTNMDVSLNEDDNNNNNYNYSSNINKINFLTLQTMTNNQTLDKYKNSKTYLDLEKNERKQWRKELKFYKHRILDETKKFLKNSKDKDGACDDEVTYEAFKAYSIKMINYFKKIDTIDIIQDDYLCLNTLEKELGEENKEDDTRELNKEEIIEKANILISNTKTIPVNLDKFVIKRKIKNNEQQQAEDNIPKKKEINLDDPKLKKKGIRKKKLEEENITTN